MRNLLLSFAFIVAYTQLSQAQNQVFFKDFRGKAYAISKKKLLEPFDTTLFDNRIIEDVNWKEINYKSSDCIGGIGDLWIDESTYGIYLKSTMGVSEKGCYEFSLDTDDGSYLWIDNHLVIDNSGDHKMTYKKQNIFLEPGKYDVRIWYYQLQGPCGFIFNALNVKENSDCNKLGKDKQELVSESFTLSSAVLFESGSHIVKPSSNSEVKQIIAKAKEISVNRIEVLGHTDNVGSEESNEQLSLKRAQSIKQIIDSYINDNKIKVTAIGKGESAPIDSNETLEGRVNNRRVEIILIRD